MNFQTGPGTDKPRMYLIGLISYGVKNCGNDSPSVYTKVSEQLEWILDRLN